jgi:hypothetical protein
MHLVYAGSSRKNNTRQLVSYGCRNGEAGSVHKPFAYDAIERAFLELVAELKPADILDASEEDDPAEKIAALEAKLIDLDAKIAKVQQRVTAEETIDTLLSLLERLDKDRKATATQLDQLKANAAHQQPTALGEVQSLAVTLGRAKREERKALRLKIRARVQQLVSEMWVLVWDESETVRMAELQVFFRAGGVRCINLCWTRRGRLRGHIVWTGTKRLPDLPAHPDRPKEPTRGVLTALGLDLREYRRSAKVRNRFAEQAEWVKKMMEAGKAKVQKTIR